MVTSPLKPYWHVLTSKRLSLPWHVCRQNKVGTQFKISKWCEMTMWPLWTSLSHVHIVCRRGAQVYAHLNCMLRLRGREADMPAMYSSAFICIPSSCLIIYMNSNSIIPMFLKVKNLLLNVLWITKHISMANVMFILAVCLIRLV